MATGHLGKVIGHLRATFGQGQEDAALLEGFLARRDEAAFETLVRRHGPMVLGVCRRVLRNDADAEDAFQATFLVLACKGASVLRRGVLGNWLYGVAHRTALEARRAAARRRAKEASVMHRPSTAQQAEDELREVLDQELAALPEKYRAALVLCDLEGKSRKEVAEELGLPEGTVASRVARARSLLAKRLVKYGLAPSASVLATALGHAIAAVPAPLVSATVRTAVLVAAGQTAALAMPAAALMKGVIQTMYLTKLKVLTAALMVAVTFGAGGLVYRAARAESAADSGKRANELEALRKENELLKINLQVVLEKVKAQEEELRSLKTRAAAAPQPAWADVIYFTQQPVVNWMQPAYNSPTLRFGTNPPWEANIPWIEGQPLYNVLQPAEKADPIKDVEAASKALREAKDKAAQKKAADALDKALKKVREQLK
jgi:RNA polymerase sigma factor (sigma-70 family)